MLQEGVIERFVLEANPTQFNYKMLYLLIPGHEIRHNDNELYDIINLAGDVLFQATCLGQLNVFCVVIKDDDSFERKIHHLESLIKSVRILGVVERSKSNTNPRPLKMTETDYKLIQALVEDPRAKVDEVASRIRIASKTVSRSLTKLTGNRVIRFGILYNPTRFRGYIPFHILVYTDQNAIRKVLDDISKKFEQYFFGYPEINPDLNIIILDMYSTSIYELDELYKKMRGSSGVKSADLLIPTEIRISHKWLLKELETKLSKKIINPHVSHAD
jgi:DNA-binding Lrp family transcriptional regulator